MPFDPFAPATQTIVLFDASDFFDPEFAAQFPPVEGEPTFTVENIETGESVDIGTPVFIETDTTIGETEVSGSVFIGTVDQAEELGIFPSFETETFDFGSFSTEITTLDFGDFLI